MNVLLEITYNGKEDPIRIFLYSDEITIGRRNFASLNKYKKVSRDHAVFSKRNGSWFVRDLGGRNKLYVNFIEINENWIEVETGDIIGFGTPLCYEEGCFVCILTVDNSDSLSKHPYSSNQARYHAIADTDEELKTCNKKENYSHVSIKTETVESRIRQGSCDSISDYPYSSNQNRYFLADSAEELKTSNKNENVKRIRIKTEPFSNDYDNYESGVVVTKKKN
ncbi:putative helicase senataxin [Nephila pilipes]|uniref:Putative helicase senataxin n=1 Tax=Nephila pilipes TaxID=299642 RepID=A0A8X6PWN9_NEPPI|nr:putative helicase senataxin [Nephila pilipes]